MKVVCFIESVSRLGGGLFDAERRIQQTAVEMSDSLCTNVVGMEDEKSAKDLPLWRPIEADTIKPIGIPKSLGYSDGYAEKLKTLDPDLVYCVGLWKYFNQVTLQWCRKNSKPYIVAPHGMADGWAMRANRIRKKLLWFWYQKSHLENATCIRVLNDSEAESIRQLGLKNPICVIPNGVDLPSSQANIANKRATKQLLFLGRIHPKKGLDILLKAWKLSQVSTAGWELKIAGWGDSHYVQFLNRQIAELQLSDSIEFVGPVFERDKEAVFRASSAFVLPSFSEGMPMTILEAWSYELPVLMTPHCNIPEGSQHDACFMCEPHIDSVSQALHRMSESTETELRAIGQRGRSLVESDFSWPVVADKLLAVYRWLLGKADPPSTVRFD